MGKLSVGIVIIGIALGCVAYSPILLCPNEEKYVVTLYSASGEILKTFHAVSTISCENSLIIVDVNGEKQEISGTYTVENLKQ